MRTPNDLSCFCTTVVRVCVCVCVRAAGYRLRKTMARVIYGKQSRSQSVRETSLNDLRGASEIEWQHISRIQHFLRSMIAHFNDSRPFGCRNARARARWSCNRPEPVLLETKLNECWMIHFIGQQVFSRARSASLQRVISHKNRIFESKRWICHCLNMND